VARPAVRCRSPLVGNDPDPSFSFANERTFLAWTRTALTLINVGLIFTQVLPPFQQRGTRLLIGLPLIVIGTITAAASLRRWAVNEQAIRLRRALPRSWLAPALTVVVTSVAAVAIIAILLWGRS
jgi:putative membrane protein